MTSSDFLISTGVACGMMNVPHNSPGGPEWEKSELLPAHTDSHTLTRNALGSMRMEGL